MKTKFTSDELPHIWAHKSAPYGSSPGSMSFNSDGFYSYSTQIARHIEHNSKPAVIYNETSYSVTTSKQQGKVACAIPSYLPVFRIGNLTTGNVLREIGGKEIFNYAIERAAFFAGKIEKARNKDYYQGEQKKWLEAAAKVNEFFGLRRKVDEKTVERLKVASARAEATRTRKEEADKERIKLIAHLHFNAWIEGSPTLLQPGLTSVPVSTANFNLFPVAFRVEGDELVSTLGARVPMADAKRAFRFALAARAKGWHRNGETCLVGNYQLDVINEQGVIAGCHRVTWAEVDRLTPILA